MVADQRRRGQGSLGHVSVAAIAAYPAVIAVGSSAAYIRNEGKEDENPTAICCYDVLADYCLCALRHQQQALSV